MDDYKNVHVPDAEIKDTEHEIWHAHIRKQIYLFFNDKKFLIWVVLELLFLILTMTQIGLLMTSDLSFTYLDETIQINGIKFIVVPLSLLGFIFPVGVMMLYVSSRDKNDDLAHKGLSLIGIHFKIVIAALFAIGAILLTLSIFISAVFFLVFIFYAVLVYIIHLFIARILKLLNQVDSFILPKPHQKIKDTPDPLSIRGFAVFMLIVYFIGFLINLMDNSESELINLLPIFQTIQTISTIQSFIIVLSISMAIYLLGYMHKKLYYEPINET